MAKKTASPKAQVNAYIAAFPPNARKALTEVRATVKATAPGAEEAFSYRMPAFRLNDRVLVWYAAFTNHFSLFPIGASITRPLAKDVVGYETSKGTIRFPLSKRVPVGLIRKIVKARIAEVQARGR
jgi:uncharacterized protein YdhG (YjbR/CyaY superfamily)